MTEYGAFVKSIPMVAEMVVRARQLTGKQYQEWRQEALATADRRSNDFAKKVLQVIDDYRSREVEEDACG